MIEATVQPDSHSNVRASVSDNHVLHAQRQQITESLKRSSPQSAAYATQFVEQLLAFSEKIGTSDVHLQPTSAGLDVRFRHDGVLQHLGEFPSGAISSVTSRLKVLSNLLTYRSDIPQEGRIALPGEIAEVRVSTYPTLYGERAVLRFFGRGDRLKQLSDLGHTETVTQALYDTLAETSGAMIVTGPAGSGKSTTLYACLRELARSSGGNRSLMSIEDPIEVPIAGVSQSQVNVPAGFDLHTGLRSLLRQDPEVIMIGEIRDPLTAEIAIQACLTGQLMLTTFHADSTATAVSRLLDMGIEPYLLRSGVIGILSQRLLRKLCKCAVVSTNPKDFCGLPVESCFVPKGCDSCNSTGYSGRVIASEFLSLKDSSLADQILDTKDSRAIYRIATESGMESLWRRATQLVRDGVTSPIEVRRVLGMSMRT
jgi:general secretion pathway protein E